MDVGLAQHHPGAAELLGPPHAIIACRWKVLRLWWVRLSLTPGEKPRNAGFNVELLHINKKFW